MTKPRVYLQVFKGKNGQHFYRVKNRNGRTLTVSEGYTRKHDAIRGAQRAHPDLPLRSAA